MIAARIKLLPDHLIIEALVTSQGPAPQKLELLGEGLRLILYL